MRNAMTKRLVALLLALAMIFSMGACGKQEKQPEKQQTEQKQTEESLPVADEQMSRQDQELIVELMGNGEDVESLSDAELSALVDSLIADASEEEAARIVNLCGTRKENLPSIDFSENKDAYDENGAITKPFDQVYPEVIEKEQVAFSGESILVKLRENALTDGLKAAGIGALEEIVPLDGCAWYEAMLTEGTDAKQALAAVRELDETLLAEYNYEAKTAGLDAYKHFDEEQEEGFKKNGHNKDQWHHHHCGIPDGYEEMETEGGDPSVIVAVIDTGVDYDHEDLADNMWCNTKEIPGNGVDDDGNGYVDDYYGIDLVVGKGSADDDNGHGTHVAGIIAGRNNNTGIVGLAYNVKIMPIKAAMHNGALNQADIAKAILYAYEMGAEVINMSFGGNASSIAVQDALSTAYTRCVLVASAGNSGYPNQTSDTMNPLPNYPAALTYVLGVMSVDENGVESAFSNWDTNAFNAVEYELYAPGENIMSTLPGDRYGYLTGTSMAAPVVSAMAAILRSEFSDRDMYPTKFIYGQLASTSDYYATCVNPNAHSVNGKAHNLPQIVNLYAALTEIPSPEIGLQDYAIFDSTDLSDKNNGNGVIDAGETIALGLTLRNRWGMSENTLVTIDTLENGISDPYVELVNPSVDYGSIGTYSTGDCGKVYTNELHTGWEKPFILKIAEDCPNDYRMTFHVSVTCENALNEEDQMVYTAGGDIQLTARNGVVLPSIIEEDMVLTSDNLYIIPNATVIQSGATVRVEPGTHIQFWSDDPEDPYASNYIAYLLVNGKFLVEGTKEDPVYIYPSERMDRYGVEIGASSSGYVSMKYADVTNFFYSTNHTSTGNRVNLADHCTFRMNYGTWLNYRYLSSGKVISSSVYTSYLGNIAAKDCVFYKIGYLGTNLNTTNQPTLYGSADRCVFVDCGIKLGASATNCVFLGNSFVESNTYYSPTTKTVASTSLPKVDYVYYREETGTTYVRSKSAIDLLYLNELGGQWAIIETQEEKAWLQANVGLNNLYYYRVGIRYDGEKHVWSDGTTLQSFVDVSGNAQTAAPGNIPYLSYKMDAVYGTVDSSYIHYLYEIPGHILPTEITFAAYEVSIDTAFTYQVTPLNTPVQLPLNAFIYESSDESVLAVSDTGFVTPVSKGTADVYVYSRDRAVYNYVTIHVEDYVALESLALPYESINLAYGETAAAPCELSPANTTRRNVVYTSSDTTIATVDTEGNVTATGFGTAVITAACEGYSAQMSVTVSVDSLTFRESTLAIAVGESMNAGCIATPANTAAEAITYTSSNEAVAIVDAQGDVSAIMSGTAVITAQCDTLRAELAVTVYTPTKTLRFEQDALGAALPEGSVPLPELSVSDNCDVDLQWQSTDEEIAQVADSTLQLKKAGTTTLLVTDRYTGLSDSMVLYVRSSEIPEIKQITSSAVLFADGRLCAYDKDGYSCLAEGVVCWSGSGCNYVALQDGTLVVKPGSAAPTTWTDFQGKRIADVAHYYSSYGSSYYYAVTSDGEVYASGTNTYGQLGTGGTSNSSGFSKVDLDAKVVQVECSDSMAYLLTDTGDLYVAGGSSLKAETPQLVARNVTHLSVSSLEGAVFVADNIMYYFGNSDTSAFGVGTINTYDWVTFYPTYAYSGNVKWRRCWGVGAKDGDLYRIHAFFRPESGTVNVLKETEIGGVENGVAASIVPHGMNSNDDQAYIATADGLIYSIYNSTRTVYSFESFANNELELTGTNLTGDALVEDALELYFNKSVTACSDITLYENGTAVTSDKTAKDNCVTVTYPLGFTKGNTYTLVINSGGATGTAGAILRETVEFSFTYTPVQAPEEETQPEETPDTHPEETAVIHESQTDTTIERIPTATSLTNKLGQIYKQKKINPSFYGNAILNPISTDTNVEHWFRLQASSVTAGVYSEIPLGGNYWGTTDETAIGLQMIDYSDFITYARLMYEPYLTEAPENTFPFVTDVKLINKYGEEVRTVGNEQITFRVTFNRDMDTSIPLQVRFGSAAPYGDYEIEGKYVDARTWEGVYTLKTIIENGNQRFTISNGCSATDDLELQLDRGRFGFVIDTSAAQALIMQGTATDTGIELRWSQDDFDTLMGYNVYRSTKEDGQYTRLNKTVIPAQTMTFFDDAVEPGKVYYYNFTVVKTDLTESEPSGKIVIMSKDTMAPNIYHSPVANAFTGANLVLSATVTDNLNISYANLYYRIAGTDSWNTIRMNNLNDKYSAIIPAQYITVAGVEYYIEAFDGVSFTYKGSSDAPYTIAVQEAIDANALGDVDGDGVITNLDAVLLLYAINDKYNLTAEEFARADLNGDGVLWAAEALRILQYVSGVVGSVKM